MAKITKVLPLVVGASLIVTSDLSSNAVDFQESDSERIKMCVEDEARKALEENNFVLSYTDVFRNYFEVTEEKMKEANKELKLSFNEFCSGYYASGLNLEEYVGTFTGEFIEPEYDFSRPLPLKASTSSDEKYILKGINDPNSSSFNPSVTPSSAFQRDVKYANTTKNLGNGYFTFSNVQNGDILIETDTDWYQLNMGHCALIYDINKANAGKVYGRNDKYIQDIEAVAGGVQFGFIDDQRMVDFGCVIVRPSSQSTYKINKAKEFALAQVGNKYALPSDSHKMQLSIDTPSDRTKRTFYYSELVYAAYKYAGTSVAYISGEQVWPMDILNCSNTKYITFSDTLDVKLLGKKNGKWNFRVFNNTGSTITLEYNTKLCFADDAISWNLKKDVNKSITISSGSSSSDILVGTNWFATTAAMSYVKGGRRYITYANELNENLLRPTIRKNIIRA